MEPGFLVAPFTFLGTRNKKHAFVCSISDDDNVPTPKSRGGAQDKFRGMARDLGSKKESMRNDKPAFDREEKESRTDASIWQGWESAQGRWNEAVKNAPQRDMKAEVDKWRSAAKELAGDMQDYNTSSTDFGSTTSRFSRDSDNRHKDSFSPQQADTSDSINKKKSVGDFWKNMAKDLGQGSTE